MSIITQQMIQKLWRRSNTTWIVALMVLLLLFRPAINRHEKTKNQYIFRSSRPEMFCKKVFLRNFAKFTGKHLGQSLFFNKVAGRPATLLKKRLWPRCFPVNFAKFLRKTFLQNTSGRLLLNVRQKYEHRNFKIDV